MKKLKIPSHRPWETDHGKQTTRTGEDYRKKEISVKLPQNRDLTECGNCIGIILLSVPGMIFGRVHLHRINKSTEKELREEQAGFGSGISCTHRIFLIWTIVERSLE